MKMNLKVFKKGKPIYWIGGAVILFVLFYWVASRKAPSAAQSSGGGVVSYNQGPSDAQIMAASQISAMQIEANVAANRDAMEFAAMQEQIGGQVAIATMESQLGKIAIESQTAIDTLAYETDKEISLANLDAQKEAIYIQSQYGIETARIASEEALTLKSLERAMFKDQLTANQNMLGAQLTANQKMLDTQSKNMIAQTALSQVGSLKKKDRDETLQILALGFSDNPVSFSNPSGAAKIHGFLN